MRNFPFCILLILLFFVGSAATAQDSPSAILGLDRDTIVQIVIGIVTVLGGVFTLYANRFGAAAQLKRLEVLEKRLEITASLVAKSDADDIVKNRLRAQIRDITAELLTGFGEDSYDKLSDSELESAPTSRVVWSKMRWHRRWVFPPLVPSLQGWVYICVYYFFGSVLIAWIPQDLLAIASLGAEISTNPSENWTILGALTFSILQTVFVFFIVLFSKRALKSLYGRAHRQEVERIFVERHIWNAPR